MSAMKLPKVRRLTGPSSLAANCQENSGKLQRVCRLCRRYRQGAAAVEFAVIAPVFFLMILGMIELGRAVMVQQVLTNAAREGARLGVLDGSTVPDIQQRVRDYLPSLPTAGGLSIQVNPNGPAYPPNPGERVEVVVSIPFSEVSWVPMPKYVAGGVNLTATAIMRREGVE